MRRCGVIAVSVFLVACCLCAGASGGVGYYLWSAQPALAKEMHEVTWTQADANSWQTKNEQFQSDIKNAHDSGKKEEVEMEVTEAESTAMLGGVAGDLLGGASGASLKKDVSDGTGGWVSDFGKPQVNYINGATYTSMVIKVRGFDMRVAFKSHTEIVNGRPRLVVDRYEAGLLPINQQIKDLLTEWLGPGQETLTFTIGPNTYTVGNLIFSGDSFSIDYSIQGVTEYLNLTQITVENGKTIMRGVTK